MTILMTVGVLFLAGMLGGFCLCRMKADYTEVLRILDLERMRGLERLEGLRAERDVLRERQGELEEKLREERQEAGKVAAVRAEMCQCLKTPIDWLLHTGKLKKADLAKAEDYRIGTRSEMSLGEVLVLLGMISETDKRRAEAALSALHAG